MRKYFKYIVLSILLVILIILVIIFINKKEVNIIDSEIDINDNIIDSEVSNMLERYVYKDNFYYEKLSNNIKKIITGITYPSEFSDNYTSISYDDLRYVRVSYIDFSGNIHNDGELIVNKEIALDVLEIFYELYINKYSIDKIKLVDYYNGDDNKSMSDNNTSAFNYRLVEESDNLSWHCFGLAIDINPLYNPYILNGHIYPESATDYVDRTKDFKGKIDYDDLAYKLFTSHGFKWGGDFINSKDYQHFYKEIYDNSIRERKG